MRTTVWRRAVLLALLAAIGVTIAGVGATLGMGNFGPTDDRIAEVSVAGNNLSVSSATGEVLLTEQVSEQSDIEVATQGGGVAVREVEHEPFTQRERQRAIEIARANSTVASSLETIQDPTVTVEPIRRLTADNAVTASVTINTSINGSAGSGDAITVGNVTVEQTDDTVTIDREPSYAEERAVVQINRPGQAVPVYSVTVDLETGTVTAVTTRQSSPSGAGR